MAAFYTTSKSLHKKLLTLFTKKRSLWMQPCFVLPAAEILGSQCSLSKNPVEVFSVSPSSWYCRTRADGQLAQRSPHP